LKKTFQKIKEQSSTSKNQNDWIISPSRERDIEKKKKKITIKAIKVQHIEGVNDHSSMGGCMGEGAERGGCRKDEGEAGQ
jgi:hypothetical protein